MNQLNTLRVDDKAALTVTMLGIDPAKNGFALHGVNVTGKTILERPHVRRDQLLNLLAQLPACIAGMEACSGAHHHSSSTLIRIENPKFTLQVLGSPYSQT